jgi:hypothetical protein
LAVSKSNRVPFEEDAVSEQGCDKNRCQEFLFARQKEIVKELRREEGYIGRYLGCGLCQTRVPCEAGIPPKIRDKRRWCLNEDVRRELKYE